MKFQKISTILIWSQNWQKLAEWYQNTFNLKLVEEINHPQDTGKLFEFSGGETWLWIGHHSEIKGQNLDPYRIMFNINVDSIQETFAYLQKQGVEVVAKPFKAPTFDKWFATLSDPDGNTLQIIGPR